MLDTNKFTHTDIEWDTHPNPIDPRSPQCVADTFTHISSDSERTAIARGGCNIEAIILMVEGGRRVDRESLNSHPKLK